MTSHGYQMQSQPGSRHPPNASYGAPAPMGAPAGTFAPGTKIQVGSHRVLIQKYLSEGGFAHVYLVKLPQPVDGTDLAVLKRVAVPDKDALRSMRTEVETMKRLKGHRPIVTYIDSHASEMRGGGYEVFLLMEFCNGGGLIDFMNTRLQHRLTEPEIINIFTDIAEGVACMHYLKPPLLHRDIKVENVLITARGSTKRFKLCDFGSASPSRPAPTTVVECRLMEEDVQKHTTLQYRSPEMVDVYRKQPMNEKCDIWALGVLLYKLCYYTTPFEDQGQLAILNASFRYPSHPVFSDRLKKMIASMLKESMKDRPNIYQVLKESCAMQGREVPILDIYSDKPQPENRGTSGSRPLSTTQKIQPKPAVGAVYSPPEQEEQVIPDITPMRRGRPTPSPTPGKSPQRKDTPPNKVTDGDPFAALDYKGTASRSGEADELSSRFPSINQFSLLHDQGSSFDFDPSSSTAPTRPKKENDTMAQKLADAAFSTARQTDTSNGPVSRPQSIVQQPSQSRSSPGTAADPQRKPSPLPPNQNLNRPPSVATGGSGVNHSKLVNPKYVSTGTWTGDMSPQAVEQRRTYSDHIGTAASAQLSNPRGQVTHNTEVKNNVSLPPSSSRVSSLQAQNQTSHNRQPSSDRSRLAKADHQEPTLRPTSVADRPRPASTNLETSYPALAQQENVPSGTQSHFVKSSSRDFQYASPSKYGLNEGNRIRDEPRGADASRVPDNGSSDLGPSARLSNQQSLGTRNGPPGKFGDAFKRFESNTPTDQTTSAYASRPNDSKSNPSVTAVPPKVQPSATQLPSDDESLSPEQRREMERLVLEREEQRVEAAQAEYRKRLAEGGSSAKPTPGPKPSSVAARSSSIQNRVQTLLSEEQQPSNIQRTAHGYGKYTDAEDGGGKPEKALPIIPRKPLGTGSSQRRVDSPAIGKKAAPPPNTKSATGTASAPPVISRPIEKPSAPKKPVHLNSFPTGAGRPDSPEKEQLVAVDLPGQPAIDMSAQDRENYIADFSKRFPSLSAMEMEPAREGRR